MCKYFLDGKSFFVADSIKLMFFTNRKLFKKDAETGTKISFIFFLQSTDIIIVLHPSLIH